MLWQRLDYLLGSIVGGTGFFELIVGFGNEVIAFLALLFGVILTGSKILSNRLMIQIQKEELKQQRLRTNQYQKGNFDLSDDDSIQEKKS